MCVLCYASELHAISVRVKENFTAGWLYVGYERFLSGDAAVCVKA